MTAPLLPQDRYIAALLGLSEEEMRWYKAEVQKRAAEGPQPAVVAEVATAALIVAIVNLVIGVGLTIVSLLLAPRPADKQGRLNTKQRQGETLQVPGVFAPTYGFEAVQDIAPLGDPIPLVYARRQFFDGKWFGGVRVSTPLLWSQMWSLGGNQMLRAMFLVSEGSVEAIHPYSFAIGNNTLGAYSFDSTSQRISIYSVPNGGRMAVGNLLSGSAIDIGASGAYASDIFRADIGDGNIQPTFCGAYKPSTSTSFGLYSPIGNGLGYRLNPRIRPLRQLQPDGNFYDAVDDAQAVAEAWKYKYCYSGKSGIIGTSKGGGPGDIVALTVNDTFTYMLSSKSDAVRIAQKNPVIAADSRNIDNELGSMEGEETLVSVGQSVAGRQKQYDASLQEGEIYKVGSALAILTSRDPVFISESDYSQDSLENTDQADEQVPPTDTRGTSAFYTFKVVRAGSVGVVGIDAIDTRFFDEVDAQKIFPAETGEFSAAQPWKYHTLGTDYAAGEIGNRHYTASAFPQIFRCALGSVRLNRPTRYFEIGIKSNVAMQLSGICNFADVPSDIVTYSYDVITDITVNAGNTGNIIDSVYTSSPFGGSGTGLSISATVVGGFVTAVSVLDSGTGYQAGDIVGVNFPLEDLSVREVTFNINALGSEELSRDTVPGYRAINWKAADALEDVKIKKNLTNSIYSSGTVTCFEQRYSFFALYYRPDAAGDGDFRRAGEYIFAVASARETAQFNFMRFAMNGDATWELRLEPISSWEIRTDPGRVVLLSSGENVSTSLRRLSFADGSIWIKGDFLRIRTLDELFDLQGLRPRREIGISWTEGEFGTAKQGTYIDLYARAAEAFVYDEITTSCASGPEHEITYVNVIQINEQAPQYDNLCLVGINVRATQEWSQFSQLSAYVTRGIKVQRLLEGGRGSTHLFPEILYDYLLDRRYGLGNEISPEQVDVESFTEAARYCQQQRFFYDGPKLSNVNWREWAADAAATHALLLIERGGVLHLEQAIPERPEIRGLFTAGNCLSMELSVVEAEQRQPFSVSVKFRSERYGGSAPSEISNPAYGLFPQPEERLVYHSIWGEGPIESVDMSEYCTSEQHALQAAKYIIGSRRLADHVVKITTTFEALTSSLAPGDFIKVALDYTHYNQYNNGAVTGDGTLVATTPLSDGTYNVVYWTGERNTEVVDGQLVVSNGGTTASPTGVVFTVKTSDITTRTYRIESIQPTEDGYQIEAAHAPLLADGTLQLYAEWTDPSYWVVS